MTAQTALATSHNQNLQVSAPSSDEWRMYLEQSQMLVKTGFLPQSIKTPEQAIAIILQGRELGIPTMTALQTINVIQGKITVSPQLMLALINRSGLSESFQITNESNGAKCTMKRRGNPAHTEIFGDKEAQAMGLSGKDNYKKQPATMFRWRAVAACARLVFPDVVLGLYTPDEMGATVNDQGEFIPTANDVAPLTIAKPPSSPKQGREVTAQAESLRAQITDLNPKNLSAILAKFDTLQTVGEMESAVTKIRASVKPAHDTAERELLISGIGEWMAEREWAEGELEQFWIENDAEGGLMSVSTEKLRELGERAANDSVIDGEVV